MYSVTSICHSLTNIYAQAVVAYVSMALAFVQKLAGGVPTLCQMLGSKNQTDVLEAIEFFTTASKFHLAFAIDGKPTF